MPRSRTFVYVAVGPTLTTYRLDYGATTLNGDGFIRLPADVQYAESHVSGRTLYVASSDGLAAGGPGESHHLSALRVDPCSGALAPLGEPVALPTRPIHLCTDPSSRHVLVVFNDPPALRVYSVAPDETLAGPVDELARSNMGVYPHQVRVTSDACQVVVACRGHDATAERGEQPGSLRIISYDDGRLGDQEVVAPEGGYRFGPRDVDFHPRRPWLYVSLERQNELVEFAWTPGGKLEKEPRWRGSTLSSASHGRQLAGPVRVHPRGHVAYVVNRVPVPRGQSSVSQFTDGDNTIAVYALDPSSGEPRPIQHVDTAGLHCRTFQIDPTGSLLIAANMTDLPSGGSSSRQPVPAGLSIFQIARDGLLTLVRRHPVEVEGQLLFWMGIVGSSP